MNPNNRPKLDESTGFNNMSWGGGGSFSQSIGRGGEGGGSYGGPSSSYVGHNYSNHGMTHNMIHGHGHGLGHGHGQSPVEPMHHSPISSHSTGLTGGGGGGDRVAYLPSYLLGDAGAKSPKTKLRKDPGTPNLDLSNLSQGGLTGMGHGHGHGPTSPVSPNPGKTSPGLLSQSPQSLFSSSLHSASNTGTGIGTGITSTPTSSKSKPSGPPKHGLGSSTSTGSAPKSARLEGQCRGQEQGQGVSGRSLSSSSQIQVEGQGNWVTVFGFQPASQPFVLQTFSTVGSIIEYKSVAGCNFMHIRYSNTVEARKALSKNGGIVGGNMMLGVTKYEPGSSPSSITVPSDSVVQSRIRPLANDNLANQIPVRESGLMSKVTELLGW